MKNVSKIYVGVDISKDYLDVAFYPDKQHFRVSNDKDGIALMIHKLASHDIVKIACESSGGYERFMMKLLRKAGYHVELVDPKVVKYFIKSKKIKAKTDKIDAYMIAMYTACNESEYEQTILNEEHEELRDMVRRRSHLTEDIAREKKRLKQAITPKAADSILSHIEYLLAHIELIDIEIEQLIDTNAEWKKSQKILLSIPGIGKVSSAALIAEMSELGHIKNKQAAALLGVAPHTKQSGNYEGKAIISGGRFLIRKIMYMAALSASHAKGRFSEYYQRLKSKSKKAKVCLVALMNKMICTANALLRKGEMWNPSPL